MATSQGPQKKAKRRVVFTLSCTLGCPSDREKNRNETKLLALSAVTVGQMAVEGARRQPSGAYLKTGSAIFHLTWPNPGSRTRFFVAQCCCGALLQDGPRRPISPGSHAPRMLACRAHAPRARCSPVRPTGLGKKVRLLRDRGTLSWPGGSP